VGGVKVGFVGVTLKETPSVVTPAGVAGLEFRDEAQTINALVPVLRQQGATVIVALLHQGGQTTATKVQDKSCPGFAGEIVQLVDRLDAAVDVVVTGHTHQEYICTRPDGKLVTQSGPYGRMLTRIDLTLDGRSHRVIAKDANNLLVSNGAPIKDSAGNTLPLPKGYPALTPDPAIDRMIQDYAGRTAAIAGQPVGQLADALLRRPNAAGESTLGAVVADMYLAGSSDARYGTQAGQIAFTNPGGLRADLPAADALTFGQLFSALPFNNNLVTVSLSGGQIHRLLEQQWEQPQPPGGRILAVSQGFSYQWSAQAPERAAPGSGARVVPGSIRLNGVPLEPQQTYRVTVNNFMAGGGDNFALLREGRDAQDGDIDLEVAQRYLRAAGLLHAPPPGRIQRLD
jgi:5'-nucleotidase